MCKIGKSGENGKRKNCKMDGICKRGKWGKLVNGIKGKRGKWKKEVKGEKGKMEKG